MDEPFGALDPLTRAEMQDMLRGLLQNLPGDHAGEHPSDAPKTTVLLVTHDLDEALYLADRIVLLEAGKLITNLEPAEFLRSQQPEVISYIRAFHRGEKSNAPASATQGEKP
jgi:osmoprotectant transport system ATP-binding protein